MGLTIGLDIDGVVADSFTVFMKELNKHYGKNVTEIDNYDMTKVYDVCGDDLEAFFDHNMEYLFITPKPMEGAVETIYSWLEAGHDIVFVTARKCGAEEEVTLKWFDKNGIPRDKAVFMGGLSKTFAVKEYDIDVFVEDFMTNALEIASTGIPVFILDASYNQGKLPRGVTRCYNWEEIKCQIDQLANCSTIDNIS